MKQSEPISSNTFLKLPSRLIGKDERKKRIWEIPQKDNPRIPHDMGCSTNAGCGRRSRNSGQGGRGQGGHGRGASATVPRKASGVCVCKDLEGHVFTIRLGNKGKDGHMLLISIEKWPPTLGTYCSSGRADWMLEIYWCRRIQYIKVIIMMITSNDSFWLMCCRWWHIRYRSLLAILRKKAGKPKQEIRNLYGFHMNSSNRNSLVWLHIICEFT